MSGLLAQLEAVLREPPVTELAGGRGGSLRWFGIGLGVLLAIAGLIGLELGWFGGAEPPPPEPEPPGETRPEITPTIKPEPGPGPRIEAPIEAPNLAEAETETGGEGEPEDGETGVALETPEEPESAPEAEPKLSGWCHLHEDHFTLLSRSAARRSRFVDDGQCYTCRVERRRSRTRGFSPRDCAGYSLCGPASARECE